MADSISRRTFVKTAVLASAASPLLYPRRARAQSPNERLNIAFVGVGGICGRHTNDAFNTGAGCPCYCDVDTNRMGNAAKRWPDAKAYTDYREMFDKHHKEIDAVMVGTPDHSHYPATMIAMQLGKHVFTQKPLTHTVWESRQLYKAVRKYKLATQMGNQGHAGKATGRSSSTSDPGCWARSARFTAGPIARSGRRGLADPKARIPCRAT